MEDLEQQYVCQILYSLPNLGIVVEARGENMSDLGKCMQLRE